MVHRVEGHPGLGALALVQRNRADAQGRRATSLYLLTGSESQSPDLAILLSLAVVVGALVIAALASFLAGHVAFTLASCDPHGSLSDRGTLGSAATW